jgi:hypothetical protein
VHSVKVLDAIKAFQRIAHAWLTKALDKASRQGDHSFTGVTVPAPESRRKAHAETAARVTAAIAAHGTGDALEEPEGQEGGQAAAPSTEGAFQGGEGAFQGGDTALSELAEHMMRLAEALLTESAEFRAKPDELAALDAVEEAAFRAAMVRFGVSVAKKTIEIYDGIMTVSG